MEGKGNWFSLVSLLLSGCGWGGLFRDGSSCCLGLELPDLDCLNMGGIFCRLPSSLSGSFPLFGIIS